MLGGLEHLELWINEWEPRCLVPSHEQHMFESHLHEKGGSLLITNMRVLAINVVREDDDLEDVRVNRFDSNQHWRRMKQIKKLQALAVVAWLRRDVNVIHPSGRSSVTPRTSCRSPGLVPARTESAAGVWESSYL